MNFELNTDYLNSIIKEPFFRQDVRVKDNRHLVFTTERQLEIIRKLGTLKARLRLLKTPSTNSLVSMLLSELATR